MFSEDEGSTMKKVLVVDDEPDVRELLNTIVSAGNYRVFFAGNGKKAIEIANEEEPDLIILDIMLPGEMNGFRVAEILKDDCRTRNCKILMLTALVSQEDKRRGFSAGVDEYFIKPFSPMDLICKIVEMIGISKTEPDEKSSGDTEMNFSSNSGSHDYFSMM